ncbi:hypothetical protein GCM10023191_070070 [Actinoallomurus oryzae]|uniref:PLD phosphodiesterase domain-containing protein n=1 Tax=Actinoallomurus oryzae TaxID=502180 RepID=A0ABP8QUF6_9ACTN
MGDSARRVALDGGLGEKEAADWGSRFAQAHDSGGRSAVTKLHEELTARISDPNTQLEKALGNIFGGRSKGGGPAAKPADPGSSDKPVSGGRDGGPADGGPGEKGPKPEEPGSDAAGHSPGHDTGSNDGGRQPFWSDSNASDRSGPGSGGTMVIDRPTTPDKGLDWLYKGLAKFEPKKTPSADFPTSSRDGSPVASRDGAGHEGGGVRDGVSSSSHDGGATPPPKRRGADTSSGPARPRDENVSTAETASDGQSNRDYSAAQTARSYEQLAIARGLSADEALSWSNRFFDAQARGDRGALQDLKNAFDQRLQDERAFSQLMGRDGTRSGAARGSAGSARAEPLDGASAASRPAPASEQVGVGETARRAALDGGLSEKEAADWADRFTQAHASGGRPDVTRLHGELRVRIENARTEQAIRDGLKAAEKRALSSTRTAESYERMAVAGGLSPEEARTWGHRFYVAQRAGDPAAVKQVKVAFGRRLEDERLFFQAIDRRGSVPKTAGPSAGNPSAEDVPVSGAAETRADTRVTGEPATSGPARGTNGFRSVSGAVWIDGEFDPSSSTVSMGDRARDLDQLVRWIGKNTPYEPSDPLLLNVPGAGVRGPDGKPSFAEALAERLGGRVLTPQESPSGTRDWVEHRPPAPTEDGGPRTRRSPAESAGVSDGSAAEGTGADESRHVHPGDAPTSSRAASGGKRVRWADLEAGGAQEVPASPAGGQDETGPVSGGVFDETVPSAKVEDVLGAARLYATAEARPVVLDLSGSAEDGLRLDGQTAELLARIAPPQTVFVTGRVRDGRLMVGDVPVDPAVLAALIEFWAPGHQPFLLMPGSRKIAGPLATATGGPVQIAPHGVLIDVGKGTMTAADSGKAPVGRPNEARFEVYLPQEQHEGSESSSAYAALPMNYSVLTAPADVPSTAGTTSADETNTKPVVPNAGTAAPMTDGGTPEPPAPPQPPAPPVPPQPPAQSQPIKVDRRALSALTPRLGLPYMRQLIAAIRQEAAAQGVTLPEDRMLTFVKRLVSNYAYALGDGENDANTSGLIVPLGEAELLVTFDPADPHTLDNPAGAMDGRPATLPAPDGDFVGNETINSSYATGAHVQTTSGQTEQTHGAFAPTFGIGVGVGPLNIVRIGGSVSGTANQSNRSMSHVEDAEGGHVEDYRGESTLLAFRPNISFKLRTERKGVKTPGWAQIKPTRIADPGTEELLLWAPEPYTKEPSADPVTATGEDVDTRRLPRHFYASGLTNLPELFDEILGTLASQGQNLEIGSVTRDELLQKLDNLNTHLDKAVNDKRGYRFTLHDKYGDPLATVQLHAVRLMEGVQRVGATSDKVHVEVPRTGIDGTSGGHTVSHSSTVTLPSVDVGFVPPNLPDLGISANFSVGYTSSNTDSVSAGKTGLWVMVPRYTGHTAAYAMEFALQAKVMVRHHGKTANPRTATNPVRSRGLVRLPEPEAFRHGLPVDRDGLKPGSRPTGDTVPYAPDALTTGPRGKDAKTPKVEQRVELPEYLFEGKGIGFGTVRPDEATVDAIREMIASKLRPMGFLPEDEEDPFAGEYWYTHGNKIISRLDNEELLDKMVSVWGFASHYDRMLQDGMRFTLKKRRGTTGVDLDVDSVEVEIKATQRADTPPKYLRTTDEYHLVNLPMGMDTAGMSTGHSRKLAGGFKFKFLYRFLQGAGFGVEAQRIVGATDAVTFINNQPDLLEHPGDALEVELTNDYRVTLRFQHSGQTGKINKGGRDLTLPTLEGQKAIAHLMPIDLAEQPAPDQMSVPELVNAEKWTPAEVLDQGVVFHTDTTGLTDAAASMLGDLVGPAGAANQNVNAFAGLTDVRAHLKEIFNKEYTTDQLVDPGLFRNRFAALDIAGDLGPSTFVGATSDNFVLGIIKLLLLESKLSANSSKGVTWDQLNAAFGGNLDDVAALTGASDVNRHWQANASQTGSRVGGKEYIQVAVKRAFLYQAPAHFTVSGRMEKHAKLLPSSHTKHEPRQVNDRTLLYVLTEPEALKWYANGTLPVSDAELTKSLTRWRDGDLRLNGDVVAGVLTRWHTDLTGRPNPGVAEPELVTGLARDLARMHGKGGLRVMDPATRERFGTAFDLPLTDPPATGRQVDMPQDLVDYATGERRLPDTRLAEAMTAWQAGDLELTGDVAAGILHRWKTEVPVLPDGLPADRAAMATTLAGRHTQEVSPVRDEAVRAAFNAAFGKSLPEPPLPFEELRLPEYLTGKSPFTGHSGLRTWEHRDGRSTYRFVKEQVDEVAPGLLSAGAEVWDREGRVIGRLQGGVDALQALLAKRRDQTMIDELLGEEGLSLYLVHPNGWLLADVVEVRLRLALGKPEVRDFAPGENNEVYLHGYQGTATSTSRDVSQGATFPQISPGGRQSVSGGGSGALKASVGDHRGVTRAENNVVEQTEYGFDHYILGFDTELTAEVRRLGMPHRPLNNLLNRTFDGWTHHSATRTATIDGTLEIQLPRALAESGAADTAHPRPNLTPLPKLPEDAVITGVVFDDTVRIGRDLLARMFPPGWFSKLLGERPGDPDLRSSLSMPTLLSRMHLAGHLRDATGGDTYKLGDNIFRPGADRSRATLSLKGDLSALEVLAPLKAGAGVGRYTKHQSGTTVNASTDHVRGAVDIAGSAHGPMGEHTPGHSWDLGTSNGRSTSFGDASAGTENYRREQHPKEKGPLYLVRMRFHGRLRADLFHHHLFGSPKPKGRFYSDPITGYVYAELYQAEVHEIQAKIVKDNAETPPRPESWPAMDEAPSFDLAPLLARAAQKESTAQEAYQDIAKYIRRQIGGYRPVVLTADEKAIALQAYQAVLDWGLRTMRADLAAAREADPAVETPDALRRSEPLPRTPGGSAETIRAAMSDIINAVNEVHALRPDNPAGAPAALPPLAAISQLDLAELGRDVAHTLGAHLRVDVIHSDATVRQNWSSPGGSTYFHDPATTSWDPGAGLWVFDKAASRRRMFTSAMAEQQGLVSPELRAELDLYGLGYQEMGRLYLSAQVRQQTFEQAVRAELGDRTRRLSEQHPVLPVLLARAAAAHAHWQDEEGRLERRQLPPLDTSATAVSLSERLHAAQDNTEAARRLLDDLRAMARGGPGTPDWRAQDLRSAAADVDRLDGLGPPARLDEPPARVVDGEQPETGTSSDAYVQPADAGASGTESVPGGAGDTRASAPAALSVTIPSVSAAPPVPGDEGDIGHEPTDGDTAAVSATGSPGRAGDADVARPPAERERASGLPAADRTETIDRLMSDARFAAMAAHRIIEVPPGVGRPAPSRQVLHQILTRVFAENRALTERAVHEGATAVIIPRSVALTALSRFRHYQGRTTEDGRPWEKVRGHHDGGVVAIAEENLLGEPGPGGAAYSSGYSSALHEVAHLLYEYLDAADRELIERRFAEKTQAGGAVQWPDGPLTNPERSGSRNYSALNAREYWAQLTAVYLGTNAGLDHSTGLPRNNTLQWLKDHEGPMLDLLERIYGPPGGIENANPVRQTRAEESLYQGFRMFMTSVRALEPDALAERTGDDRQSAQTDPSSGAGTERTSAPPHTDPPVVAGEYDPVTQTISIARRPHDRDSGAYPHDVEQTARWITRHYTLTNEPVRLVPTRKDPGPVTVGPGTPGPTGEASFADQLAALLGVTVLVIDPFTGAQTEHRPPAKAAHSGTGMPRHERTIYFAPSTTPSGAVTGAGPDIHAAGGTSGDTALPGTYQAGPLRLRGVMGMMVGLLLVQSAELVPADYVKPPVPFGSRDLTSGQLTGRPADNPLTTGLGLAHPAAKPHIAPAKDYRKLDVIPHLDVWGEGRIILEKENLVTGFEEVYNLNLKNREREQKVSNGPNRGKPIPNLVPVEDYENPVFPLSDGSVLVVTLMGAPISKGTAREILRVLNKSEGKVIFYGLDPMNIKNFEDVVAESGEGLTRLEDEVLRPPFDEISDLGDVYIYGPVQNSNSADLGGQVGPGEQTITPDTGQDQAPAVADAGASGTEPVPGGATKASPPAALPGSIPSASAAPPAPGDEGDVGHQPADGDTAAVSATGSPLDADSGEAEATGSPGLYPVVGDRDEEPLFPAPSAPPSGHRRDRIIRDWETLSAVRFQTRSAALQEIDRAVRRLGSPPSDRDLRRVLRAISEWKEDKTPQSSRWDVVSRLEERIRERRDELRASSAQAGPSSAAWQEPYAQPELPEPGASYDQPEAAGYGSGQAYGDVYDQPEASGSGAYQQPAAAYQSPAAVPQERPVTVEGFAPASGFEVELHGFRVVLPPGEDPQEYGILVTRPGLLDIVLDTAGGVPILEVVTKAARNLAGGQDDGRAERSEVLEAFADVLRRLMAARDGARLSRIFREEDGYEVDPLAEHLPVRRNPAGRNPDSAGIMLVHHTATAPLSGLVELMKHVAGQMRRESPPVQAAHADLWAAVRYGGWAASLYDGWLADHPEYEAVSDPADRADLEGALAFGFTQVAATARGRSTGTLPKDYSAVTSRDSLAAIRSALGAAPRAFLEDQAQYLRDGFTHVFGSDPLSRLLPHDWGQPRATIGQYLDNLLTASPERPIDQHEALAVRTNYNELDANPVNGIPLINPAVVRIETRPYASTSQNLATIRHDAERLARVSLRLFNQGRELRGLAPVGGPVAQPWQAPDWTFPAPGAPPRRRSAGASTASGFDSVTLGTWAHRPAGPVKPVKEPAKKVARPASPDDWRNELPKAPVVPVETERLDPKFSFVTSGVNSREEFEAQGAGVQVRANVQRIQAANGTWVRHHVIALAVDPRPGVTESDVKKLEEVLNDLLHEHVNDRGYELPKSKDQLSIQAILRIDPGHRQAVRIGTGTTVRKRTGEEEKGPDARQWGLGDPLRDLLHELLHYLGLPDEYENGKFVFRKRRRSSVSDEAVSTVRSDGIMSAADWDPSQEMPARYARIIENVVDATAVLRDHPLSTSSGAASGPGTESTPGTSSSPDYPVVGSPNDAPLFPAPSAGAADESPAPPVAARSRDDAVEFRERVPEIVGLIEKYFGSAGEPEGGSSKPAQEDDDDVLDGFRSLQRLVEIRFAETYAKPWWDDVVSRYQTAFTAALAGDRRLAGAVGRALRELDRRLTVSPSGRSVIRDLLGVESELPDAEFEQRIEDGEWDLADLMSAYGSVVESVAGSVIESVIESNRDGFGGNLIRYPSPREKRWADEMHDRGYRPDHRRDVELELMFLVYRHLGFGPEDRALFLRAALAASRNLFETLAAWRFAGFGDDPAHPVPEETLKGEAAGLYDLLETFDPRGLTNDPDLLADLVPPHLDGRSPARLGAVRDHGLGSRPIDRAGPADPVRSLPDRLERRLTEMGVDRRVHALSTGNLIRLVQTPDMWGQPMTREDVSAFGDRAVGQLAGTVRGIIGGGTRLIDVLSLSPPTGRIREEVKNALLDVASREGSGPVLVRFLFANISLRDTFLSGFVKDLTKFLKDNEVPLGQGRMTVLAGQLSNIAKGSWNHSKIVAADGAVALVGGHNLWTETYGGYPPVHDVSIEMVGDGVRHAHEFADYLWTRGGRDLKVEQITEDYEVKTLSPGPARDKIALVDLAKLPRTKPEPSRGAPEQWHSGRALSLGRAAFLGDQASDTAKEEVIKNARRSLKISQQDLAFTGFTAEKDHQVVRWIAEALVDKPELTVDIVVSSARAGAVNGAYTWGFGAPGTYAMIKRFVRRVADPQARGDRDEVIESALRRVKVAPFVFTDRDGSESGFAWPDPPASTIARRYKPDAKIAISKKTLPEPANHAKVYIADDALYYVGSDNLYPHKLAEFGYLIEGEAVQDIVTNYWGKLWRYAGPHATDFHRDIVEDWKAESSLGMRYPRSAVLNAIDQALDRWKQGGRLDPSWLDQNERQLKDVLRAIDRWRDIEYGQSGKRSKAVDRLEAGIRRELDSVVDRRRTTGESPAEGSRRSGPRGWSPTRLGAEETEREFPDDAVGVSGFEADYTATTEEFPIVVRDEWWTVWGAGAEDPDLRVFVAKSRALGGLRGQYDAESPKAGRVSDDQGRLYAEGPAWNWYLPGRSAAVASSRPSTDEHPSDPQAAGVPLRRTSRYPVTDRPSADPAFTAARPGTLAAGLPHVMKWRTDDAPLYKFSQKTPEMVFRADGGLFPRGHRLGHLIDHVYNNPEDTGYVSTSRSRRYLRDSAQNDPVSASLLFDHYRYRYDVVLPGGIDVNATLDIASPFPDQEEVAFPGGIHVRFIRGVQPLRDGSPDGEYVHNPYFNPSPTETTGIVAGSLEGGAAPDHVTDQSEDVPAGSPDSTPYPPEMEGGSGAAADAGGVDDSGLTRRQSAAIGRMALRPVRVLATGDGVVHALQAVAPAETSVAARGRPASPAELRGYLADALAADLNSGARRFWPAVRMPVGATDDQRRSFVAALRSSNGGTEADEVFLAAAAVLGLRVAVLQPDGGTVEFGSPSGRPVVLVRLLAPGPYTAAWAGTEPIADGVSPVTPPAPPAPRPPVRPAPPTGDDAGAAPPSARNAASAEPAARTPLANLGADPFQGSAGDASYGRRHGPLG